MNNISFKQMFFLRNLYLVVALFLLLPIFHEVKASKVSLDESNKTHKQEQETMSAGSAKSLTLRMLVWKEYAPKAAIQRFKTLVKEKYKVKIGFELKYPSNPNEFFPAIRSKEVDLISPAHDLIKDPQFSFIEKKLLLPINLNNVPNYKNIVPELQRASYITSQGKVYGVPMTYGYYGLGYNSNLIKEPRSWNVFWDPKLSGKYTVSKDYYQCNIYIAALALGHKQEELSSYDKINTPELREKLAQLVVNANSLWVAEDRPSELQGLTIATAWGWSFPELRKRGENWQWAQPKEGTPGWVGNFVIGYSLKDDPLRKRIAEEWLNFLLSPWYQANLAVRNLGPINLNIRHLLTPEQRKAAHLDEPDYFEKNHVLWPLLANERDRNGMKFLWENALSGKK